MLTDAKREAIAACFSKGKPEAQQSCGAQNATQTPQEDFHQFGCEYEEFQDGPGNYSVAIVEFTDDTVDTALPQRIRFLDNGERK